MKAATPLPRRPMTVVAVVQFAEAFQITVLFPFIPFMMRDMPGVRPDQVGTFAGAVAACFAFGQFLSSYVWGVMADRYGTKLVVMVSLLGTMASTLVFGFSTSVAMAAASRITAGLLNGNIGVLKSYLGKVTDSTNQSNAFAVLSLAWGTGSIVAPAVGGLLADPARQYPSLFSESGLFGKHRYLLPCLVAASFVALSFVLTVFLLKETPRPRRAEGVSADDGDGSDLELDALVGERDGETGDGDSRPGSAAACADEEKGEAGLGDSGVGDCDNSHVRGGPRGLLSALRNTRGGYAPLEQSDAEYDVDAEDATEGEALDDGLKHADVGVDVEEVKITAVVAKGSRRRRTFSSSTQPKAPALGKMVWLTTSLYGMLAFVYIMMDETYPLFCSTAPEHGGLGFTSGRIGMSLSIMGGTVLFYTLVLYRFVVAKIGLMNCYRWCLYATVPVLMTFPVLHYIVEAHLPQGVLWAVLLTNLTIRGALGATSFTSIMIFVNSSVPMELMGRANGIGQSMASLARAVGPALAGVLWSQSSHAEFPFHQGIPFACISVITLITAAFSYKLPPYIIYPFAEQQRMAASSTTRLSGDGESEYSNASGVIRGVDDSGDDDDDVVFDANTSAVMKSVDELALSVDPAKPKRPVAKKKRSSRKPSGAAAHSVMMAH